MEEHMSKEKQVRVEVASDGTVAGTKVTLGGEMIPMVRRVQWVVDASRITPAEGVMKLEFDLAPLAATYDTPESALLEQWNTQFAVAGYKLVRI